MIRMIKMGVIFVIALAVIGIVNLQSHFNRSANLFSGSILPKQTRPVLTLSGFKDRIGDVVFYPGNNMLAIADSGAKVNLWNLKTGMRHRVFEQSDDEGSLAFSANGQFLMSAAKRVWNAKTGKLLRTFQGGHRGYAIFESQMYDGYIGKRVPVTTKVPAGITAFIVSPNGQFLATSSNDRTTEIWDAQKGKLRWTLKGHTASIESIAFSPDGNLLASGSLDRTIKLWDVKTGKLKRTLKGHSDTPRALGFFYDGKTLASAGQTGELFVWDVSTGQLKQQHQSDSIIPKATFSADGKRVATSIAQYGLSNEAWGDVWIYDIVTGKVLFKVVTAVPDSLTLSSDGKMLAVGGVEYSRKYKNGFRIVVQVWHVP